MVFTARELWKIPKINFLIYQYGGYFDTLSYLEEARYVEGHIDPLRDGSLKISTRGKVALPNLKCDHFDPLLKSANMFLFVSESK